MLFSNRLLLALITIINASIIIQFSVYAEVASELPSVNEFIIKFAEEHDFKSDELHNIFDQVTIRPEIIEAITRPAEAKPWYEYRALFLTQQRIDGGIEFWNNYQDALSIAESRYGVDPAIIVAIIGVETRYGAKTGNYRILDALTTLAFKYPKRAAFFLNQLEEYLILTRGENMDPLLPKGSYAGAMGLPQFMPSSFRDFAVDLDEDGHRDIWNNAWDAIGSVANYLHAHNWQPHEAVAVLANFADNVAVDSLLATNLKPNLSLERFRTLGIRPNQIIAGNPTAALLKFANINDLEYWLCFQNFYAITRYNHSQLYAMAVYQLAQAIKAGLKKPD